MLIVAEKLGRHDKTDRLSYQRKDGSSTGTAMPRQGILPHDLVHYVVETELGLREGFTGLVAQGASASFAMENEGAGAERGMERNPLPRQADAGIRRIVVEYASLTV